MIPVELIPPASRLLIVAAHPDDETIGAGGLMCSMQLRRDTTVAIAHLSDGAPNDMHDAIAAGYHDRIAYARARRAELDAALERLPDGTPELYALGFRDQEAAHALVEAVAVIRGVIETFKPTLVMTHPYEGGHPDHDAAAFAAYAALRGPAAPRPLLPLVEMTSYHWTGEALRCGQFLPSAQPEIELRYSRDVLRTKQRMLRCFKSQRRVIKALHVPAPERFRTAPQYEFRRPPAAPGYIYYERFAWGLDSNTWCQYAAEALSALQIVPAVSAPSEPLWH